MDRICKLCYIADKLHGMSDLEPNPLNFLVSGAAGVELNKIAERHRLPPQDVVRLGITLAKVALDARESGNKLVIATQEGGLLKEILLPEMG